MPAAGESLLVKNWWYSMCTPAAGVGFIPPEQTVTAFLPGWFNCCFVLLVRI